MAGCGGTSTKTPLQVVTGASRATQSARTARVSSAFVVSGRTISMDGTFDFRTRQAQATETIPALGTIDVLLDGLVVYEKLPAALTPSLGGKPWVKIDAAAVSRQTTATTQYAGTVDLSKAAAAESDPARRQALQQEAKLLGVPTMSVNVWIDGSGRLAQMHYLLDLSKLQLPSASTPPTPLSGTMDITYTMFDFGVPFTMPPLPAADQTTDLSALAGAGLAPSTTVPAAAAASVASQLGKILFTPPGFSPSTAADVTNGPVDGPGFDKNLGTAGSATRFGFVGGNDVTFDQNTGSDSIDVTLLQFATPAQSAAMVQVITLAKPAGTTQSTFGSIPGAVEYDATTPSSGSYDHEVFATKGNRLMVVAYSSSNPGRPAGLAAIAVKQYRAL